MSTLFLHFPQEAQLPEQPPAHPLQPFPESSSFIILMQFLPQKYTSMINASITITFPSMGDIAFSSQISGRQCGDHDACSRPEKDIFYMMRYPSNLHRYFSGRICADRSQASDRLVRLISLSDEQPDDHADQYDA